MFLSLRSIERLKMMMKMWIKRSKHLNLSQNSLKYSLIFVVFNWFECFQLILTHFCLNWNVFEYNKQFLIKLLSVWLNQNRCDNLKPDVKFVWIIQLKSDSIRKISQNWSPGQLDRLSLKSTNFISNNTNRSALLNLHWSWLLFVAIVMDMVMDVYVTLNISRTVVPNHSSGDY